MKLFSQMRGCNTQVNHFLSCMKLFSQMRDCNTQVNHFLCCMKLFSQIRHTGKSISLLSSEGVHLQQGLQYIGSRLLGVVCLNICNFYPCLN